MGASEDQNLLTTVLQNATLAPETREKISFRKLFRKVDVLDYAVLWFLSEMAAGEKQDQKFYLKDLAEKSGIPLHHVTDMVRKLQEENLVTWRHDGSGEEGTYIQITEYGMEALQEQHGTLRFFHSNVLEKFGQERFLALLREISALEELVQEEIEKEDMANAD